MSAKAKFSLGSILILFLIAFPLLAKAQESMSKAKMVTGCLQKGVESGGYFIAGEDGTTWELSGKIDATHVGHKVTVSGHVRHRSKAEEAKITEHEKQEANSKPYEDLQVASVKMVSDSCQ
jgi:Protein of unknown function (DUF5818)